MNRWIDELIPHEDKWVRDVINEQLEQKEEEIRILKIRLAKMINLLNGESDDNGSGSEETPEESV